MQGTGTQTDPFYPTNWSEFVTAIGQSGVYIECPENGVWDMNEMLPDGLRNTITWKAKNVRGNGLTINNLCFNGGYFDMSESGTINIYKINFLNMAALGSNSQMFNTNASSTVYFRNSKFSGLISNGSVFYAATNNYAFIYLTHDGEKSCSLNFKFTGNGTLCKTYTPYFKYCNIKFDGDTTASVGSDYTTYEKCYISGKSPWEYSYMYGYDNIIDIEIPEGKKIASSSSGHMNTSVLNIDKMHGSYQETRYKYIEATTEQLSDAAYLQSKGFSIAG